MSEMYLDPEGDPSVEYRTPSGDIMIVTFDREKKCIYFVLAGKDYHMVEYLPDEFMREVTK